MLDERIEKSWIFSIRELKIMADALEVSIASGKFKLEADLYEARELLGDLRLCIKGEL